MHTMRRKDRQFSESEAQDLLCRAEWGILSLCLTGGRPYGVPVNFCVLENNIYFHCALEGRKQEGLMPGSAVSFCAVGLTQVLPEQFGTLYESVIAAGIVNEVFGDEKHRGLAGLLKKYAPDFQHEGQKYIDAKAPRTRVYKIAITEITGKARKA